MRSKFPNKVLANMSRKNYNSWKKYYLEKGGYFTVFNTFLEDGYLRRLSGGAVKLFLYFGISSKNDSGESFHSVESIARYFGVSNRTIGNWIEELESMSLIKRMQLLPNEVSHTFLQPY